MEACNGHKSEDSHQIKEFKLERFFAKYELTSPYALCSSDCEPLSMSEALDLADEECKQMWDQLGLAYTDPQGALPLRQEICKLYKTVSTEDVIVAAPQELISMAFHAMLRPGDHVVSMFPGYQSLYEIARHIGCDVSFWEPEVQKDGGFVFEVQQLSKLVTSKTRAVVVNFPHNPTGALASKADWEQIVQLCKQSKAYLFSDEMYRLLERDSESRLPAAVDAYERGVSLSGMSKAFGMPGIRIGWLALKDAKLMRSLQQLHDYSTICSSAPSEVLALIGLRAAKTLVQRNLDIIEANVAHFRAFCERHSDVMAFAAPTAGSIAFARLLTGEPIEAFCVRLVEEAGVLLLPATVYDHQPSIENASFRVGLGRRNMPECLRVLEGFLKKDRQRS
ncbi:g4510 [Coccomyxa viridis]|uniref:G4510 protein n=1 Tax=Coccomyxa viridis TaxID=1274662 RepID=A0ABP1FQG4_9CHLO